MIVCRRSVQHCGETPEFVFRQREVAPIEKDRSCLSASCLQHEIRTAPPKGVRCPIDQGLLIPADTKVNIFCTRPYRLDYGIHIRSASVSTNNVQSCAHNVNTPMNAEKRPESLSSSVSEKQLQLQTVIQKAVGPVN